MSISAIACAAALSLPVFCLCRAAAAQDPKDPELARLLQRIDAAFGPERPFVGLAVDGRYEVWFEGAPGGEPVAKGPFRERFRGADLAHHVSEMGAFGSMQRGTTADFVWELDPHMGPRVYARPQAAAARRYFALLRGERPKALYAQFARGADAAVDGVDCAAVRMTTAAGVTDTWLVDAAGLPRRIDIALPAPESAEVTFGMSDFIDAQLSLGDWQVVDGVQRAHRRSLQMGPATVRMVIERIDAVAVPPAADFAPPKAVAERAAQSAAKDGAAADGKPQFELVERPAQPVASIRLTCKTTAIAKAMSIALPEVMEHLNATGAKIVGPPFSRYHGAHGDEVDLECGLPIGQPIAEKGRVKNGELPAGRTATTWHIGPYEKLAAAHGALALFVAGKQLKPRGGPFEVYWTDPGMVPDPAKWRTQLFQPVE